MIKDKEYIIKHSPLGFKDKIIYGVIFTFGLVLFVGELVDIIKGFF
jgi:hypothetical protein